MPSRFGLLLLPALLSGCLTTQKLFSLTRDFAVGAYQATAHQIQLADRRAAAFFDGLSPQKRQELKESGSRYLAVRTADPSPAQMAEIRRDRARPGGGAYGTPATGNLNRPVYCVMIWDTQSREVVGTDCYAALTLPKEGEMARFDTYTAEFVGSF